MTRRKISEYRAKIIVNELIGNEYVGWSVTADLQGIESIDGYDSYVVKVDQAVKKRFKNGLVKLDVKKADIPAVVREFSDKGYEYVIVEPFLQHNTDTERYINWQRTSDGVVVAFSQSGGVNIEDNASSVTSLRADEASYSEIAEKTGFSVDQVRAITQAFDEMYLAFLEINPYVVVDGRVTILDVAIEVDAAATQLVKEWTDADFRSASAKHDEEAAIQKMNEESSASFNLSVLNENGSIFLLLSGGGASVVIADEIYSLGFGGEIANYGEYSGNPSRHETYLYTQQVLGLLTKSGSKTKVLFIGGAVANFTDIASTFNGIIEALREHADDLRKAGVKVYVRRGGPRQAIGLKNIEDALTELQLLGGVYSPEVSIGDAVKKLVGGLK